MIRDISAIRSANQNIQSSKGKEFNAQRSKFKTQRNKKAAPTNGCRIRDSPPPLIRREERPQGVINMLASKAKGLLTYIPPTSMLSNFCSTPNKYVIRIPPLI